MDVRHDGSTFLDWIDAFLIGAKGGLGEPGRPNDCPSPSVDGTKLNMTCGVFCKCGAAAREHSVQAEFSCGVGDFDGYYRAPIR
jgi:hypothetical protein